MEPLAPALFSTITGCLRMADMACPTTRAIASLAPPAAVGTTMAMGFSGKAAAAVPQTRDAVSAMAATRRMFSIFNLSPPSIHECAFSGGSSPLDGRSHLGLPGLFCELHVYEGLMHTVNH